MKNFLQRSILIALLFVSYFANAQTSGTATGKVLNGKDKSPLDYASIAIKKLSDSSTVGGTNTSATGTFTINGLTQGKYRLYVVYLGLKTITKDFELTAATPGINFGNLTMEDTGVTLNAVEIKGEIPPVVVKKDTLEISASTLKVKENAVVEDLLKKVPGVDVAKDGTITAQGETIKKVRVDGKDFMGSDPLLATRNLPADMVDKIQIIDDMSDQSKFSGVDDGNREKIINITTKNGVKNKGIVGNSTVGYGTDDRYDVNLNANYFNKQQQISFIGQFNNVNKQNFGGGITGGGGGGRGQFGGGSASSGGITTTNAAGINFGDTYDDGTQVNGSYFFNKTSLFNTNNSFTQNLLANNTITNLSDLNSTSDRLNHRLNFMIDTKLDSNTSIRVQPSISYTENTGYSIYNYNRTVGANNTIGNQNLQTNSETPSISNSMLIRHRFQRRGRTLSLNISTSINDSDADNFNYNLQTVKVGSVSTSTLLNQLNDNNTHSLSNTARLVFTEPLSKTLSLETNYQNGYSFDNKERFVYTFNNATQSYDIKDNTYSNEYENTTWTNSIGLSLQKTEKKYNWNVGLAGQYTTRANVNVTTGEELNRDFINLTPTAQFRYNFSNSKRLTIRYNGRTNQPTIDQIQPIPDNTQTQIVPIGNPNLKPSFQNSLNIFYNNFDFATYRTFFIGGFFNQYFNAIANDQRVNTTTGIIQNGYANVDGNFSASVFSNVGQPIIKGNKLTLQINVNANYDKSTNLSDGLENVTKSLTLLNGYKLVSNLDKLDLIAGISGSWTHGDYSLASTVNSYTLAPNIDVSYLFPGNIRLQSDVTYNQTTGRGADYNTSYTLVNAYMSRQFFKNKGTFKLSVNDLFNENTGISRTVANNQISDVNFNVLKRYYMFSFTYSLGNIGGRSMQMPGQGGGQRMRMGGM
ncbi:TonB-dependent receptor [Pedobacter sp. LMG 31464]|uniref:TonB-dependent receptor n=1 Tax=Pedobacter planticolens TaxID=2679964 RepID=A0A923IW60_9SPHI|nr:outer membrane beta-barrel family protein [Pedobacter planticolens]MBB2145859.1 TonB-dependent receptor [Pedobacter planticolens]